MFRKMFRLTIAIGLFIWLAMLAQIGFNSWSRVSYERQRSQRESLIANQASPTPLVLPTVTAPTLVPLPDTVVASQGDDLAVAPSSNDVMSVHPKTGRYIAAWLPTSFDAEAARATFEANKDLLDEVSPFWYGVAPDGRIIPDVGARDEELVRIAHENNVLVIPTVHNIGNAEAASVVIDTPEARANHIAIILDEVLTYNYDGIDIDYEALTSDMEADFTAFMSELSQALHAEGKLLTIAVHAHTGRPDYQNYAALGAVVDRFRIMTYDYSWSGSPPGPIAPLFWVQQVAEYAATVVDPAKIQIGISFYAYDWPANWQEGGSANALTYTDIEQIKAEYRPRINHVIEDERGPVQESSFAYAGRTVWFSNKDSLSAKMDMIRSMNLAGIAIWRLGNEDPDNWNIIRSSLQQDPLIIQRTLNQYIPEH